MVKKKDKIMVAIEWMSKLTMDKGFYLNELLEVMGLDPTPSSKAKVNKLLLEGIRLGYLTRTKQKTKGNPYLYSRSMVFDNRVFMDAYKSAGKDSAVKSAKKKTIKQKKKERRSSFKGLLEWTGMIRDCLNELESEIDRVETRIKSFLEGEEE